MRLAAPSLPNIIDCMAVASPFSFTAVMIITRSLTVYSFVAPQWLYLEQEYYCYTYTTVYVS